MAVSLRKVAPLSLVIVVGLLAACGGSRPEAPVAAPAPAASVTPAPAPKAPAITIKVAYPGQPETKDYPSVLAWKSLPADKYKIEIIPTAGISNSTNTVISGEADVASASVNLALNGTLKGANVRAIAENVGMHWRLITHVSVKEVVDLTGKPIALGAPGGIDSIMYSILEKKYKIKPEVIRANQSSDRIQALINGQVLATVGSAEDLAFALNKKPGQFKEHVLFAKEAPNLGGTYFFASGNFAAKQPQAVQDLVEALIASYRKVNDDRSYFLTELKKAFPTETDAKLNEVLSNSYAVGMWDKNGRMARDTLNFTMNTYFENKTVPEQIPIEKWAAPEFAEKALAKMGKR